MRPARQVLLSILFFGSVSLAAARATSAQKTGNAAAVSELEEATQVVENMSARTPGKGVPKEVLQGAKCIAVVPRLIKGAIVVGGERGAGVATCRTNSGWSAPAPFSLSGVSWGAQIGGKSTDLMMFIMNDEGVNDLMTGRIKVGADVSATAGPAGEQDSTETGWKAGILTYSSSKGAFVGASLNGAELQQDIHATEDWYGRNVPFKDILQGQVQIPNAEAHAFVSAIQSAGEAAQAH
jgi:lipid-binding SYLF domain-containing protein